MPRARPALPADRLDAVIFDLDGVVTDTAVVHAAAWKRLFDEYLALRSRRTGEPWRPFDTKADYLPYIDGKPRYDGVRSFLESRGVTLPEGDPSDPADRETVCGLGNRKDALFLEQLDETGPRPFATTVALVRELQKAGIRPAVVSASRNMDRALASANLSDLFDVRVSGVDADEMGLPGKPDPAIFLEAARRLGVDPARAAVVEDALAGVEAARRGGFGLVVGVDRAGHGPALAEAGADVVVPDLGELGLAGLGELEGSGTPIRDLPLAVEHRDEIARLVREARPAMFLDYDGVLTPIVEDPARATLAPATREVLERLASVLPVAVISGRDLDDVRPMVGLPGLWYAGSHGFDIAGPGGARHQRAAEFLSALDGAEAELGPAVEGIPGARVERKRFAIAVHYRQVEPGRIGEVEAAVDRVAGTHPDLRKTGGKKVFELRPDVPWDKGRALTFLLGVLGLDRDDVLTMYIGDDETDEDAFRVIRDRGLPLVVKGEDDRRPTLARYALRDPDEVRDFLELLLQLREASG